MRSCLEKAWNWRQRLGLFDSTQAIRVFHGPGEGVGGLLSVAVDRFKDSFWVTQWESSTSLHSAKDSPLLIQEEIIQFLNSKGAKTIVALPRPQRGVSGNSVLWSGQPLQERFEVREGDAQYWIQFHQTKHPGLFLDHAPLRAWLAQKSKDRVILNAFAYTGSLSVAAAKGGAKEVTTLDLSAPSIQWAKENFTLNQLEPGRHRFISGDVFEWLPRLKKEKRTYDCIILDPPSFSHGKKGNFSTSKDLERLHHLAIDLLSQDGLLITSINSANITWKKYESDILGSAKKTGVQFMVLKEIEQPETFPTGFGQERDRYLKGWILKRVDR